MVGYTYLLPSRLLAQGSAPPAGVRIPFDTVVLAALEYQPDLPGYEVLHVPLDDGPPPDAQARARIRSAAHAVASRVRAGRRVLVTCWQGRNRSGVIAGLAMRELGIPGAVAARRIRLLRNGLHNPHFMRLVLGS